MDSEVSLQLRVLRVGLLQDGDVGVGVFPEGEEIWVCSAGFGGLARHGVGSAELEMRQRTDEFVEDNPPMIEDFLELGCCLAALMRSKMGFSAHINGVQIGPIVKAKRRQTKLIGSRDPKRIKR